MKTIVSVLVSFIAVVACCLIVQCNAVKASAANELEVTFTEIGDAEVAGTQKGDFRMDFAIANNTGFATIGVGFDYDKENFYVLSDNSGNVLYTTEVLAGSLLVVTDDADAGRIGIGGVAYTDMTSDGVIISVYFRRKENCVVKDDISPLVDIDIDQCSDSEKEPVSVEEHYAEEQEYEVRVIVTDYIVGDVDGDGEITEFDSQIVDGVLDANGGTISAADFEDDVPFYEYDGVVCIGVVDVDNDGDIDAADGQEILRYHVVTEVMSGTYTGNVGTTGYLYTTVTVPITNDN